MDAKIQQEQDREQEIVEAGTGLEEQTPEHPQVEINTEQDEHVETEGRREDQQSCSGQVQGETNPEDVRREEHERRKREQQVEEEQHRLDQEQGLLKEQQAVDKTQAADTK